MPRFTVSDFARRCKEAMAAAEDRQQAARSFLERTLAEHATEDLLEILNGAIPPGADIGEMIVHTSSELTLLFGRVPPRFQSGIHNHTIFACIGQLTGEEENTLYERDPEGGGLRVIRKTTVRPGEVIALPADVIHSIENPGQATACALHIYGGDFQAVLCKRSLWTSGDHVEGPFSFEGLLSESVRTMKQAENETGLVELVKAVQAAGPWSPSRRRERTARTPAGRGRGCSREHLSDLAG